MHAAATGEPCHYILNVVPAVAELLCNQAEKMSHTGHDRKAESWPLVGTGWTLTFNLIDKMMVVTELVSARNACTTVKLSLDLFVYCLSLQVLVVLLQLHSACCVFSVLQDVQPVRGDNDVCTPQESRHLWQCLQRHQKRRTFCVVYLVGVAPSARASVHSRVTMQRTPFFFAMHVTWRGACGLT